MHIYIPYASDHLGKYFLEECQKRINVRMEMELLGRPRLRKNAYGTSGIPHLDYKVRLFPIPGSDEYRALSTRTWDTSRIRRINAVCWHAYKNFFCTLYSDYAPDAVIKTGYISKGGIEYYGQDDFINKYAATKETYYGRGTVSCRCSGDTLAVWEKASEHLPPGDLIRKTG